MTTASPNRLEGLIFGTAALIHLATTAAYFGHTWELIRTGAVSLVTGLVWVVGLACLYVAAVRMVFGRRPPGGLLLVAAASLAFSAFKLGFPHPPAVISAIGSAAAALVWVLAQPWVPGAAKDDREA